MAAMSLLIMIRFFLSELICYRLSGMQNKHIIFISGNILLKISHNDVRPSDRFDENIMNQGNLLWPLLICLLVNGCRRLGHGKSNFLLSNQKPEANEIISYTLVKFQR